MSDVATTLAEWAHQFVPEATDFALAQRSLVDTAAVTLAARTHPVAELVADAPDAVRWAALGHVLDFDDVHVESTTHISAIIVPAVLAVGGDGHAYLAGAGVLSRLGNTLGWHHYALGWHATATAGGPAAAVAAGVALGLGPERLATAMALAVPASGGVQDAFGTHGKSLQVGFAAQAGVRAALLARAGATANTTALDSWLDLVGANGTLRTTGPAVPGGIAVKVYPCCYALQRPIAAVRELRAQVRGSVHNVHVRAPRNSTRPLVRERPNSGLTGKFSLPYAVATALLDDSPDFAAFTDHAVRRDAARELVDRVSVEHTPERGADLLAGQVEVDIEHDGPLLHTRLTDPPGSPTRPPNDAETRDKLLTCGSDVPDVLANPTWRAVRALLDTEVPRVRPSGAAASAW